MSTALKTHNPDPSAGWQARLHLVFARRDDKTVIARREHLGPLRIQRPFYPEQEVCHAYVLHPPGGVVGGDELQIQLQVGSHAHALVTTPASAKFYRSAGEMARQTVELEVANGGVLEYLPQDTILFDACQVNTVTRIRLAATARYAGWEILCLGRPASGEAFHRGQCRQVYELYRENKPLVIERTRLFGGSKLQSARWGLAGYPVTGTFLVSNADTDMLAAVREAVAVDGALFSATLINDVLVCRYLGSQGIHARDTFTRVWQAIRPAWAGRVACRPRIWDT